VVGAEILDRVQFPYAVVPIVRAHHERWNGTGYPDGLKGEQIPLSARILAAVDCLDAMSSDRQYRRGLPLDEAMAAIVAEAGTSYDPRVVDLLRSHYREWEALTRAASPRKHSLSTNVKVYNGGAPAAGFQATATPDSEQPEFLSSIAAARQEVQMLYELSQDLGNSLNLHETLAVLDSRLRRLIPYDGIAVYVRKEDRLVPQYVSGENVHLFSALRIPLGQGLSGWVAETGQPIINGNPSVEPGYLNDPTKYSTLRSALAVPLEGSTGVAAVLALYRAGQDAFTAEDLRVVEAIGTGLGLAIECAAKLKASATAGSA